MAGIAGRDFGFGYDYRSYTCLAELTPGQKRWSAHIYASEKRFAHYQELIMKTKLTDGAGVTMDGPDDLPTAGGMARLIGATAGSVSARDAGIIPMTRPVITEDMVRRAREVSGGLDHSVVRTMLEAALHG